MRVLIVHNAYREAGGEDSVVRSEIELLSNHGHDVSRFDRHNAELTGKFGPVAAMQALWSIDTTRRLAELIKDRRPDVVHVHNTWPLISPSVYWACATARVPVVQTLHNFRLACPQAMFLRDGRICQDCLGKLPWAAVQHGCYRSSRIQSAVLASTLALHRGIGTWRTKVNRYIALNGFCRDRLVEAGLPADRVVIKPHFVDSPASGFGPRKGLLFVGRLSPEKGIRTLMRAMSCLAGAVEPVMIAGSGPLLSEVKATARVQWLGQLVSTEVHQLMSRSSALVLPSECLESFPRVLVEAFSAGLPVIASRLGALAELVSDGDTGLLFAPGDARDLAAKIAWANAHPEEMKRMGLRAHEVFEAKYTPGRNLARLLEIYVEARADLTAAATGQQALH